MHGEDVIQCAAASSAGGLATKHEHLHRADTKVASEECLASISLNSRTSQKILRLCPKLIYWDRGRLARRACISTL
jgi:hypothetical protein